MDADLPVQDRKTIKQKRTRTKSEPALIQYDIVSDVMKQKADIEIGELIQVAPTLRRKLISECRPKRISTKQQQQEQRQPMIQALDIVDDELNTTAAHSTVYINDKKIKTLVDCGAAKTCMSKELADMLGLEIDAPSESVFTLGNNSKQPALGIIYDVPIEVKEDIIIPCTVEVLPSCPSHLILGTNWLNRAKAKIDFNSSTLKVRKNAALPKIKALHQNYQQPISLTNSKITKHVHFNNEESDESHDMDTDSSTESEESYSEEEDAEKEEEQSLLVLDDDQGEKVDIILEKETYRIKASSTGLTIHANTSKTITIDKPMEERNNHVYLFDVTHPTLLPAQGYFDPCISLVSNKRNLEIHIFNRTGKDIQIEPEEELGILEKFNLQKDTIKTYQRS
ncbi:hypothetical protein G6F42_022535 [Rhizopus arrhizus]|nr:hypothetical protein G6F42_022535 [Rhizopus arrhizus]